MYEPKNRITFHALDETNPPYPEENVLWYRDGEPPYAGSMLDCDFPGLAYFYAYSDIPLPSDAFAKKFTPPSNDHLYRRRRREA